VQRVVGGIHVQSDGLGRLGVGVQEQVNQQILEGLGAVQDLEIWSLSLEHCGSELDAVQGGVAGQGSALVAVARPLMAQRIRLANGGSEQGVGAQGVVIVEILVAACQRQDALRNEFFDGVLDAGRVAVVDEALRHLWKERQRLGGFAQKKDSSVAAHAARVEFRHHFAATKGLEGQLQWITGCIHRADLGRSRFWYCNLLLRQLAARCVSYL